MTITRILNANNLEIMKKRITKRGYSPVRQLLTRSLVLKAATAGYTCEWVRCNLLGLGGGKLILKYYMIKR